MSNKTSSENDLSEVLRRYLNLVDNARCLTLTSIDGVELITVFKSEDHKNGDEIMRSVVQAYASTIDQPSKLGLGEAKYSISWLDGTIILHSKLESLIITLFLEEYSNLGLAETNLQLLNRILRPFCS